MTLLRDANGFVHGTRSHGMTILLCEEKDGHRDYGTLIHADEDPTIECITCLQCLAAPEPTRRR
jgi:hypothetical protein